MGLDIYKIKEVIQLDISEEQKEQYILGIIANDKNAIPIILKILNNERKIKEELILDANVELSKALLVLKDVNLKYNKKIIVEPKWIVNEIIKYYKKWKNYIKCNFNIDELIDKTI